MVEWVGKINYVLRKTSFIQLSQLLGATLTVHSCGDNPTGIPRAFTTGKQPFYLNVLAGIAVAGDTYRRGGPAFHANDLAVVAEVPFHLAAELA
jgi:hypothetical protein